MKIKMPSEISSIYEPLRLEVTLLHGRWNCYKELFEHSQKRVDLLNEAASSLFFFICDVLVDEIQICLIKLTDSAKTNKKENLSLRQLQARLMFCSHKSLAEVCESLLKRIEELREPIWEIRNKRLAHLDLKVALKEVPLSEISKSDIENVLSELREYMNQIEAYFNDRDWDYEHFVMTDGADALISTLIAGLRYEELVQARKIPYDDLRQSVWHDA